jgi:hypothetical protein
MAINCTGMVFYHTGNGANFMKYNAILVLLLLGAYLILTHSDLPQWPIQPTVNITMFGNELRWH